MAHSGLSEYPLRRGRRPRSSDDEIGNQLHDDLTRAPPVGNSVTLPSFAVSRRALATWLDATREPRAPVGPAVVATIEDAARPVAEERPTSRDKVLEDLTLQRVAPETARNARVGSMALSTTLGGRRNRCGPPPAVSRRQTRPATHCWEQANET